MPSRRVLTLPHATVSTGNIITGTASTGTSEQSTSIKAIILTQALHSGRILAVLKRTDRNCRMRSCPTSNSSWSILQPAPHQTSCERSLTRWSAVTVPLPRHSSPSAEVTARRTKWRRQPRRARRQGASAGSGTAGCTLLRKCTARWLYFSQRHSSCVYVFFMEFTTFGTQPSIMKACSADTFRNFSHGCSFFYVFLLRRA